MLGKEFLGRGAGVTLRPILHEERIPSRLIHHVLEKGGVGVRIETAFLALINELVFLM